MANSLVVADPGRALAPGVLEPRRRIMFFFPAGAGRRAPSERSSSAPPRPATAARRPKRAAALLRRTLGLDAHARGARRRRVRRPAVLAAVGDRVAAHAPPSRGAAPTAGRACWPRLAAAAAGAARHAAQNSRPTTRAAKAAGGAGRRAAAAAAAAARDPYVNPRRIESCTLARIGGGGGGGGGGAVAARRRRLARRRRRARLPRRPPPARQLRRSRATIRTTRATHLAAARRPTAANGGGSGGGGDLPARPGTAAAAGGGGGEARTTCGCGCWRGRAVMQTVPAQLTTRRGETASAAGGCAAADGGSAALGGGGGGSPQRPGAAGDGGGGGDGDGAAAGDALGGVEGERALYPLQQKEADLQRMREYTSSLASRVEQLVKSRRSRGPPGRRRRPPRARAPRTPSIAGHYPAPRPRRVPGADAVEGRLAAGDGLCHCHRHRPPPPHLLPSAAARDRVEGREQQALLARSSKARWPEEALVPPRREPAARRGALPAGKACDWRREAAHGGEAAAAEAQMAERDELEGAIEGKMLALFSRLKQLEDANLQLTTQNEELNARIEAAARRSPPTAAAAPSSQPAAASPLKGRTRRRRRRRAR